VQHKKRFIYASSAATYGDGSRGFCDDEAMLESYCPINMYAYSKHLVDVRLKQEGLLNSVVGLKYFNVFGPNEYHKGHMASMILKMVHKAQNEGVIHLFKSNDSRYPDGGQMRDFIYLKDAVRMTCAFLEPAYRNAVGIYNIGQGQTTTWNALADALFKALQKRPQIHYIDMPKELNRQYQNYTCADMRKFLTIFSSDPKHTQTSSMEESVCEYVQEYLMRNDRW
jgi:ADP-L-glycero-D-manno-heptose 6-epimerase